jgi:beta-phosphoglucomutase-like phosphatase (HAD superfamily)
MTRALIFDCDGVLADTERDGHLVAFNQMWHEQSVNWQWSLAQYAEKVKIGGGKERMFSLGQDDDFRAVYKVPGSEEEWWNTVAGWHKRKSNDEPLPGLSRSACKWLAEEALAQGWTLAVCSTSALSSVQAVLSHVMGEKTAGKFAGVFAGDMVKAKKPAPDVYTLAAEKLNLDPANCVVVEDSRNGLLAAVAAKMTCIITYNELTKVDFRGAIVLSSLGDPEGEPAIVVQNRTDARPAATSA